MRRTILVAGLVVSIFALGLMALGSISVDAQRSVMNFADILNYPKEQFRTLCRHDGYLAETDDPNTLQCFTPERETDFIIALYERGKAERWGAKFPGSSKASELKRKLTSSWGPPDIQSDPDEDGCVALAWAPDASSLVYTVGRCPRSTLFIVQFQAGK